MSIRLYAQYADKPNAVAWYSILPTVADTLFTAYSQITASWDIDTNVQEQLNVIGRIVVIDNPWEVVADDDIYRLLLKSKIAKNNSDATIDGIIEAMQYIFSGNSVTVSDFEDMSMDVVFVESITAQQVFILENFDLVPKPQGVRLRGFAVIPDSTIWGADNDISTWGDDGAQFGFYFGV